MGFDIHSVPSMKDRATLTDVEQPSRFLIYHGEHRFPKPVSFRPSCHMEIEKDCQTCTMYNLSVAV